MPKVTIAFALALILLAVAFFFATKETVSVDSGMTSTANVVQKDTGEFETKYKFTSLIPAGFGVLLLICGLIAMKESLLAHAMHAGMLVAAIGFLGGVVMGVIGLVKIAGDGGRPAATAEQLLMALLCAAFIGLGVRSFILVRRQREAETSDA